MSIYRSAGCPKPGAKIRRREEMLLDAPRAEVSPAVETEADEWLMARGGDSGVAAEIKSGQGFSPLERFSFESLL